MSRRYLGSFVTYNPVQPTTSAASGMWPLNQQYQNAGNWPLPFGDPYFNYTTLLLSTTSLGNANNNLFVDSSGAFNPISRNGNTAQGSATPYGANWSNYFDGSGDYLSTPANAAFAFGTGDFAIECWAFRGNSDYLSIFESRGGGTGLLLYVDAVNQYLRLYDQATAFHPSSTITVPVNQWVHLAATRSSGTLYFWINGQAAGSSSYTTSLGSSATLRFGASNDGAVYLGYISNLRVVKGTAVYTAAFTPSSYPLTAITNTSLLTCQSNRFRDASSNNFTITRSGDTRVTNFAPFLRTAPIQYNQSDITNWSGYFDGSGDYLNTAASSSLGLTGDWTVEGWIYQTSTAGAQIFLDTRGSGATGFGIYCSLTGYAGGPGAIGYANNAALVATSSTAIPLNTWTHLAFTRSGNTVTGYINGVSAFTYTESRTLSSTMSYFIGADYLAGSNAYGYFSNFRVVRGTAVYTGNFTPPTAPLTAISGTSILTCQNAAFTDNSTNNFVITQNGNTTVTGNSPFNTVGYWSNYFDGSGDYLSVAYNSAFNVPGDFTVEAWVYQTSRAADQTVINRSGTDFVQFSSFELIVLSDGTARFQQGSGSGTSGTQTTITSTATVPLNTWTHLAGVRNGSTITLYINGVQAATGTAGSNDANTSSPVIVGARGASSSLFVGYISNARVVKGTAVYTAAFTVPTAPLTAISGTSLLTCQANRLIDSSTNAFTVTKNGDVSVQSFDPFYTSTIASNGGSIALDGTGDYLNLSAPPLLAFGASSFTIEGWVYPRTNTDILLVDFRPASVNGAYPCIYLNSSGYLIYYVSTADRISGSTIVPLNAWSHFAVCRSGTSTTLYLNGVQQGTTYSDSNSYLVGAGRPIIGASGFGSGSNAVNGYMADVRVTNGTAIYTAAFTPPTASLTPSANTGLLVNGMNAGAYDATAINDMETVGNAQVSTVQSKFGGSSVYFDGTGDYLVAPDSANLELGSGDFTIETWVYLPSLPASGGIYAIVSKWASTQYSYLTQIRNNAGTMQLGFAYSPNASSVTTVYANASITAATWHHCAWVRNGTSFKMFLNGTEVTSGVTISGSIADTAAALNVGRNNDNIEYLTGYIDDLRITRGVARYTSNFTPPTAALPTY